MFTHQLSPYPWRHLEGQPKKVRKLSVLSSKQEFIVVKNLRLTGEKFPFKNLIEILSSELSSLRLSERHNFLNFSLIKLIEKHAFVPGILFFTGKPRFGFPIVSEKVHSALTQAKVAREFSFSLARFSNEEKSVRKPIFRVMLLSLRLSIENSTRKVFDLHWIAVCCAF